MGVPPMCSTAILAVESRAGMALRRTGMGTRLAFLMRPGHHRVYPGGAL